MPFLNKDLIIRNFQTVSSEIQLQTSLLNQSLTTSVPGHKNNFLPNNLGMTAKNNKRHIIQHCYKDHANDSEPIHEIKRRNMPDTFPIKLHQILDEIENIGYDSIISWQPHGRAFVIHKPDQFSQIILQKYFRQSKFRSFQRQLNRYGFSRLSSGKDKGGYYHEMFLRGKLFLTERIVMTKVKGTVVRGVSSPMTEPDFYSMPPVLSSSEILIKSHRENRINDVTTSDHSHDLDDQTHNRQNNTIPALTLSDSYLSSNFNIIPGKHAI